MNDSDVSSAFAAGVLLALALFVLVNLLPWSYRSLAVTAIAECEKTLPRNQQCVITAIPEEMGKND